MGAAAFSTGTTSVEELIRYAGYRFAQAGVDFRPPRMTRLIRRAGVAFARDAVDAYLNDSLNRLDAPTWEWFESFAMHADPTAIAALHNVARDPKCWADQDYSARTTQQKN